MATIKAALIGTGIFSKDVYSRLITENSTSVTLHNVWSRSQNSAEDFAQKFPSNATVLHGEQGLSTILHDPEVELVIVVLPPQAALQVVNEALTAGKHVIEEKPVAGTCDLAVASIKEYRAMQQRAASSGPAPPLWMLAENYRYEDVFQEACRLAPSLLGDVVKLDLVANLAMDKNNKYYGTAWRRSPEDCPGGMMMEASVHFVAALRMLAGACGLGEACEVSARTTHVKPDLSDPDSVVGVVGFELSKVPATVSITLAASNLDVSLKATGTNGTLEVTRGGWTGSRGSYTLTWKSHDEAAHHVKEYPFTGTAVEFASFLKLVSTHRQGGLSSVLGSVEEIRASPEEGARDLALVQALLTSGAQGGAKVKVQAIAGGKL